VTRTKQRITGLAFAAVASAGLAVAASGTASAASWQYVKTYQYLNQCQSAGVSYVHYEVASDWKCTGNYATGFSLYVQYSA